MDTNPFAANPNAPQQQTQAPNYLQQQPNNPTYPGAISNMIKAIMAGNDQYKMQHQNQQAITGGAPLSLAPPQAPQDPTSPMDPTSTMTGGLSPANMPMMANQPDPFSQGTSPVNLDPVTQALFSPIPGGLNG